MSLSDLYRGNIARLQRTLSRMLGSSDDAADIAHDAFLRAYVAELGERTELSAALLMTTARRLALNEIRNRTRRATDTVGDMDELGVLAGEDPAAHLEGLQVRRSIEAAMGDMPPQCRQVFRMRRVDEMSHAQIASSLGISTKTVERHLTKALRLCRERLLRDGHSPAASSGDARRGS